MLYRAPPGSVYFLLPRLAIGTVLGLMTCARTGARSLRAATTATARGAQNLVAEHALPVAPR